MKVFKMIWADLKIGAWRKVRYLLYAGLMLACCVSIGSLAEAYQVPMRQLSFADCLAYIWQGVYPLIRSSLDDTFMIPSMWLLLMLFTLLMPVDYPVRSMELWGLQYAVRVNKREWWISKYLYTVIVNIGTFVTGWLAVLIYCLVKGMNISLMNNDFFDLENPQMEGSQGIILKDGEEYHVRLVYNLIQQYFTKKNWEHLDKIDLKLYLTGYPEQKNIVLKE